MSNTQEIVWGPAIAVDGKRPGWLQNRDKFRWYGKGVNQEWYDQRCSSNDCTNGECFNPASWQDVTSIALPADHPHYRQPAPRCSANVIRDYLGTSSREALKAHYRAQPTPQADTKPDMTARAPCMTISEVREMVAKGEDAVIATMLERGYALPEPVDEDLIEARGIAADAMAAYRAADLGFARHIVDEVRTGRDDRHVAVQAARAALARGRALALAGEKGA